MVIRPIIPFVFDSGVTLDSKFFLLASLMACLAAVAALALAGYCSERYETDRKKTALMSAIIAVSVTLIMICFFGCSAIAVKGIVLLSVLALSSFEDIRTRECDDHLHVLIAVAAFIGTDIKRLPEMILAGFFAGSIIVLSKLIGKGKIGGADIKLAAASAFLLGFNRGIFGLLVGTVLAVIVNLLKKNRKSGFPMIPYLAAGFSAAFLMSG